MSKYKSKSFLNSTLVGALTRVKGRLFHAVMILIEKKFKREDVFIFKEFFAVTSKIFRFCKAE
jgi:hypothetical protein